MEGLEGRTEVVLACQHSAAEPPDLLAVGCRLPELAKRGKCANVAQAHAHEPTWRDESIEQAVWPLIKRQAVSLEEPPLLGSMNHSNLKPGARSAQRAGTFPKGAEGSPWP